MRCLPVVIAVMCVAPHALGQGARPSALSARDAAAGWIRLFDGETAFGWRSNDLTAWSLVDHAMVSGPGPSVKLTTTTEFGPFELTAEVRSDVVGCARIEAGSPGARAAANRAVGTWEAVRVTSRTGRGSVALVASGRGSAAFRNIRLRPLGGKPIFNGKDLAGWRVLPEHKSVFSVTPQGWLNVKNGNGDIQSEAAFGDFVLQLDVISNGDHLNSGVFFRAIADKFWSGYECQIRNQWEGDDRGKPVDFGTGGLYNLQPARRVISTDHEWCTLTVIADGYHIAIWNNGYQTVDFQDARAVDETNARNGARKAPGVISIQGHDPTTDLSFRGIRVAEMPARRQ